jgi:hypothetical protein
MGRILRNVRSITPMSRIGRKFLDLPMRIYGNFLPSVPLGRIYGKFLTTNSYTASITERFSSSMLKKLKIFSK